MVSRAERGVSNHETAGKSRPPQDEVLLINS